MSMGNAEIIAVCMDQLFAVRQAFSKRFYRRLFDAMPEVQGLYVNDPKRQEMMLFAVVSMVVKGFQSGRDLRREMFEFGRIHRRSGVTEAMFPVFGTAFLETLIEFLPEFDHPGLARAWWAVYTEMYEAIVEGMRADATALPAAHRLFGYHATVDSA